MATLAVLCWALLLQLGAGLLALLQEANPQLEPHGPFRANPPGEKERREVRSKFLGWMYKEEVLLTDIRGSRESASYIVPKLPFGLPPHEARMLKTAFRQLSVLSLAVMGIVRFASGEPILNLF